MERPGRRQEGRYSRRDRRYSDEKYELTNNERHLKTFAEPINSSNNDLDIPASSLATSNRQVQYYSTTTSQFTQPRDEEEQITSSLEELDPKTMEFDRLVELMHPTFLSDYLGRILNFLKFPSKEICFPNIAPFKEAFLVKLVTDKSNLHSESFNNTCKNICREIVKVLEANRKVFEWIHAYESGMVSKSVLVYQKSFLNNSDKRVFKVPQNVSLDRLSRGNSIIDLDDEVDYSRNNLENSSQQDIDDDDPVGPGGMSKRQRNYKALFDSVTHSFIMSALHTIADFVEDETRTTLQFPDMDSEQARFLKTINVFPFKNALYSLLGSGCAEVVRRLRQGQSSGRLRIAEGRARRADRLRDVTIRKKERKNANASRERNQERSDASNRSDVRQEGRQRGDYNPRDVFLKALSVSDDSEDSADVTDKLDSVRSQESDSRKNGRHTDDRRRGNNARYSSTGIEWQPAAAAGAATAPVTERGRRAVRGKLAQALAVPVEADKAVRMMKLMGWEGGALGARGEGITEPIMPAIDIVSGAGLGHSPTRKKRERDRERGSRDSRRDAGTSTHYRIDLMEGILALLRRQDLEEKEVAFKNPLHKKARAFTRMLVEAFNSRKNVGLNADEEKDLICRILANLNCNTRIALDVRISDDWRLVTISKRTSSVPLTTPSSRRKRKKGLSVVTELDDLDDEPSDSRLSQLSVPGDIVTTADVDSLFVKLRKSTNTSKRALIALVYRIIFLKKVHDFVNSKRLEQTISFQDVLNSRQCKFIENMIVLINKREKAGYSTRTENDLYADIKKKVDCFLKVKFTDTFRKIYLQKKYYTKRFINTSASGSGKKDGKETKKSINNNNTRNYRKHSDDRDNDEEDDVSEKRIEDMIVLSDSDDSIISLDCDYEVLDEEDGSQEETDDKTDNDKAQTKGEDFIELNSSTDAEFVKETVTVNSENKTVSEYSSASAEIIVIDDPSEVTDETLLKRCKNVREIGDTNLFNEVTDKVTDITSEIVSSDISIEASENQNIVRNNGDNEQIDVDNCEPSDASDSNTSNANGKDIVPAKGQVPPDITEAKCDAELDRQIKNLDTLKLENQSDVPLLISDIRSLATEKKDKLVHEDSGASGKCTEMSNNNTVIEDSHKETAENGDALFAISSVKTEIPQLDTSNFESNQVITNNGESRDCINDNVETDNIKAQDMNEKGEYLSDHSPSSSKRSRTESENSETQVPKKPKIHLVEDKKYIAIAPCIAETDISTIIAAQIQENMLKMIDSTGEKPLLKCYGIAEGKLHYRCHNEETFQWLDKFALNLQIGDSKFKLVDSSEDVIRKKDDKVKMSAKINSFLPGNSRDVLKRIEVFNSGIETRDWVVLEEQSCEGFYVFTVEMDYDSYRNIKRSNFSLYAAIDTVQFSRIWV